MSRNGLITFNRQLTDGTPVTVTMEHQDTLVLRDALLHSFIQLSRTIPSAELSVTSDVFQYRENILRILNRLDQCQYASAGRSQMLINGIRITVGEVEIIKETATGMLKYDDKMLRTAMRNSICGFHIAVVRNTLERILKRVTEEQELRDAKGKNSSNTEPVVNPK